VSRANPRNIAESVRQRLLNLARNKGQIFDLILNRYAIERLLYRVPLAQEWTVGKVTRRTQLRNPAGNGRKFPNVKIPGTQQKMVSGHEAWTILDIL